MFSRQSYWCIVETLKQAGLHTWPYHVYVPSFGEWGFVIGEPWTIRTARATCRPDCVFSPHEITRKCLSFPNDMLPVDAEPNRLNDQILVRYYDREWKEIAR